MAGPESEPTTNDTTPEQDKTEGTRETTNERVQAQLQNLLQQEGDLQKKSWEAFIDLHFIDKLRDFWPTTTLKNSDIQASLQDISNETIQGDIQKCIDHTKVQSGDLPDPSDLKSIQALAEIFHRRGLGKSS